MAFSVPYLRTLSGLLKFVEIILVFVALIIFRTNQTYFAFGTTLDAQIFGIGVLVAALIITPLMLLCYLCGKLDTASTTVLEPAINLTLCAFLGIAGGMALNIGSNVLGTFCICAALIYLIDILQRFINCKKT